MSDVVERARKARLQSRAIRAESLWRAATAHDRSAAVVRNVGSLMSGMGLAPADCRERAREHEVSARLLRRRARWLTDLRLSDVEVNVHLGFRDTSCRDDVLALLHDLGPWDGGELVDLPDRGVFFRIISDDLVMSEIAVRERVRFALAPIGGWEELVTLHSVWPERL